MMRCLLAVVTLGIVGCATPESLPVDARDGDSSRTDTDSTPDHGEVVDTDGDTDARDDGSPDDGAADADDGAADADADADGDADVGARDDGSRDDAAADADADADVRDDGSPDDAARDDGAADVGSLDPDLELPDPSGTPCSTPGSMSECPGIEVCRFFTPAEGRCESCEPCGNLGDFCSRSSECDILFMCYAGVCTNICPLGTYYCGPVDDCLDIGHPTYGVCRP